MIEGTKWIRYQKVLIFTEDYKLMEQITDCVNANVVYILNNIDNYLWRVGCTRHNNTGLSKEDFLVHLPCFVLDDSILARQGGAADCISLVVPWFITLRNSEHKVSQ